MPTMSAEDAKGISIILLIFLSIWAVYGLNHSEEKWVPVVNSFWIGAINFMILFYIIFSK